MPGLSADDNIIAVNGIRLSLDKLEQQLTLAKLDDSWKIHAFRRDELYAFDVALLVAKPNTVDLEVNAESDQHLNWLGGKH